VSKHAKTQNFSVVFFWIIRYTCWWLVICRRIVQRRRSGNWRDDEKNASVVVLCRLAAVGQTMSPWWMQARCLNSVSHLSCLKPKPWGWRHVGFLLLHKIRKFPGSDFFWGGLLKVFAAGSLWPAQHMQHFFTRCNWIVDDKLLKTFILIRVWMLYIPPV
jgi:hypothetical protein